MRDTTYAEPVVTLSRASDKPASILLIEGLKEEHLIKLHEALIVNGRGPIYDQRSVANAHVVEWTPDLGTVKVEMYGTEVLLFCDSLCRKSGLNPHCLPSTFETR